MQARHGRPCCESSRATTLFGHALTPSGWGRFCWATSRTSAASCGHRQSTTTRESRSAGKTSSAFGALMIIPSAAATSCPLRSRQSCRRRCRRRQQSRLRLRQAHSLRRPRCLRPETSFAGLAVCGAVSPFSCLKFLAAQSSEADLAMCWIGNWHPFVCSPQKLQYM